MPNYRFRAKDKAGGILKEIRFAESEATLIGSLRSEGLIPLTISPVSGGIGKIRLRTKDARELSALLSLLLDSGHTIIDSLNLILQIRPTSRISKACQAWLRELKRGASFQKTLDAAPVALPVGFKSLAGIGEKVGSLGAVLTQLDEYYGRLAKLRERLGTALIYPTLVLIVAIIVGFIIGIFILPKMSEMLVVLNPEMVASPSRLSNTNITVIVMASLAGGIMAMALAPQSSTLGRWRAKAMLQLPLIGSFVRDWGLLGWSFALEIMTVGGVTMDQSLTEAAGAAGNSRLVSVLSDLPDQLGKGNSLADLLTKTPYIPGIIPAWVSIGERTGKDSEIFKPIRQYFEERVSRSIDLATQLMEPILILLLGAGMVFFVLRYLLPFFRMLGSLA